jgi:hypothetical protein
MSSLWLGDSLSAVQFLEVLGLEWLFYRLPLTVRDERNAR